MNVCLHVVLISVQVKDPRYEWTRDQTLLVREVTHRDQGVYAVKFSHGFTVERVELVVSGLCALHVKSWNVIFVSKKEDAIFCVLLSFCVPHFLHFFLVIFQNALGSSINNMETPLNWISHRMEPFWS